MRRITRRARAQVRALDLYNRGHLMSVGRRLAENRLYAQRYGWWR
jgi:hypothetical protein